MPASFLRRLVIGLSVLVVTTAITTGSPISAAAIAPAAVVSSGAPASTPTAPTTVFPAPMPSGDMPAVSGQGSASTSYPLLPNKFGLELSPTRLTIGQADIDKVQSFQVVNRGQSAAAVTVQKRNFRVAADGSLIYQADAPYAASEWLTVKPMSFTVQPGKVQVVTATVKIPANPEVGDHQVALTFLVPAGRTSANIKINRGIAAPIFIAVPGPQDNTVALAGFRSPHFVTGGPVTVTAEVKNVGTVHRDFRGKSPLLLGGAGSAAAFPDFTVVRGAVRDVATTWDPPFLCVCHPSVTITNADGSVQTMTVQVIVLPLPLLLIVLGSILLLVLVLLVVRRRSRSGAMRKAELSGGTAAAGIA